MLAPPEIFLTPFSVELYNHARRLCLKKLLYLLWSFLASGGGYNGFFLKYLYCTVLLDPGGGFRIEMAVTKPFRFQNQKRSVYKFIAFIYIYVTAMEPTAH